MFNHLGLFKDVACPEGDRCALLNCIFSHTDKESIPVSVVPLVATTPAPELVIDSADDEPLRKRRRIDDINEARPSVSARVNDGNLRLGTKSGGAVKDVKEVPARNVSSDSIQNLKSVTKAVSPPPMARRPISEISRQKGPETPAATHNDTTPQRQVKKETLNPRHILKPPASHTVRMSILVKLHDAMVQLNKQVIKENDQSKKHLVLSTDELVAMALDEEEKVAKENPSVYTNIIKLRITRLRKMTRQEWENEVSAYILAKFAPAGVNTPKKPDQEISTGLTAQGEIAVLSRLRASSQVLAKAGYVTTPPTDEEIDGAKRGAEAAQGWEQCERCSGRFQVFPGRREDGLLASGGPCTYHHAKPLRPQKQKTDHITGHKESYYPCCKETVGTSPGCTKSEWHVFKVSEVKRLAAVLQFKETPRQPNKGALPPVCFDCEMGYTTLGLELIRLTAISWPEGKMLLDILVKPIGEVLDLNSRYSGVRPEHFANAIPYTSTASTSPPAPITSSSSSSPSNPSPLPIVDSPTTARSLLFQLIQPETPLIGHALENDLNACRIIHPTVVDTALLYPHPAGLPFRFGLRTLTRKFLNRHIQTGGGEMGHDSMEDARATGDLVRVKVREVWKGMKRVGWEVSERGELVRPEGVADGDGDEGGWTEVLGKGAGLKRKGGG
ncbi:hypothetical protein FQN50_004421 [Emmonsiellopsis sp. PD_5]|nr:hypothetical protein FQN50_004421 [Emmonsiellopsis sp. PD_5]